MALLINSLYYKIESFDNKTIIYKIYNTKNMRDFEKENLGKIMSFIEKAKTEVYKDMDIVSKYVAKNNIETVADFAKDDMYIKALKNALKQDEMLKLDAFFFSNGKKPELTCIDYWKSLGFEDKFLDIQILSPIIKYKYTTKEIKTMQEAYDILKIELNLPYENC